MKTIINCLIISFKSEGANVEEYLSVADDLIDKIADAPEGMEMESVNLVINQTKSIGQNYILLCYITYGGKCRFFICKFY